MTSFSEGVLLFVTKCDEGGGGLKIGQNCVTSFMDGPFTVLKQMTRHSSNSNCIKNDLDFSDFLLDVSFIASFSLTP